MTLVDSRKIMAAEPYDQHFTPAALAEWMALAAQVSSPSIVADFAAGTGCLLEAASRLWPNAKLLAVDQDRKVIRQLRKSLPNADTLVGDLFSSRIKNAIQKLNFSADVVLLNPPFSVRGRGLCDVEVDGVLSKVSPALAFIIRALEFVTEGGVLISLVPHGVIWNDRDLKILTKIKLKWKFEILDDCIVRRFGNADVRCACIRITKCRSIDVIVPAAQIHCSAIVRRGGVDHLGIKNHFSASKSSLRVIHTSNIFRGNLVGSYAKLTQKEGSIAEYLGACVIIPRVGRFNADKFALVLDTEGIEFTKCIIVVEFSSVTKARKMISKLRCSRADWESCYGGTGASFTTVRKIQSLLARWKL